MTQSAAPAVQFQQIIVSDGYFVASDRLDRSQLRDSSPIIGRFSCILPCHRVDAGRPWWRGSRSFRRPVSVCCRRWPKNSTRCQKSLHYSC